MNTQRLKQVRLVGPGINEIIHINEAIDKAEEKDLDLVLVSDQVTPPVVRIQDLKKIEYQKKKARKASKQVSILKEMQFKVNISDHDLGTKVAKIEKFLERGDKVKVTVRLKGRERENPMRARELIQRIGSAVECKLSFLGGPVAMAILEPLPKAAKQQQVAAQ